MGNELFLPDNIKNCSTLNDLFREERQPEYNIKKCARAKWYPTPAGEPRLACVEYMSTSPFKKGGYEAREFTSVMSAVDEVSKEFHDTNAWRSYLVDAEWRYIREYNEAHKDEGLYIKQLTDLRAMRSYKAKVLIPTARAYRMDRNISAVAAIADTVEKTADIMRAPRRAKVNVFDIIMCNPELDTFCTFTYAPDKVEDRFDYTACYDLLRPWLSNRVQRNGLLYVITFEEHPSSGALHFHAVMNSSALKLERARYEKTGRPVSRKGKPLYHIVDWPLGFTTAQVIGGTEDDRTAVSKYIFKYMSKTNKKIGGRYALTGGKLRHPMYTYGDSIDALIPADAVSLFTRSVKLCGGAVKYESRHYI